MSESPSNEALATMILGLEKNINDHQEYVKESFEKIISDSKQSFEKVISKQDLTNGRVKELEINRATMLATYRTSAVILGTALPTILSIFWFLLSLQFTSFTRDISYEIDSKIQANNELYFDDPLPTPHAKTQTGR